ncbi:hypothetical protein GCM10007972_24590 [Iodidimonas muriae]|uniref:DUF6362 domain-containing protein n=1 Tax=Iodidimonas muriae TaxID=261467 RepID=A0ABQ2LFQ3_9PROT|nr:DUF6362 family protein [Iodidimonas muriae]GER08803.1 hypothetical protein JCM17843_31130 [Kordiimonadales bacterium JCM 17843]GGO16013.1 hypothetical protein GCM10007972_24590 [Iodidimonas muriae]
MAEWTKEHVEERLIEAADVMKRLPEVRVQGYFNLWPKVIYEFADLVGQAPSRMRRPVPPPDAITRMEATLEWLRWLDGEDARLVWARAEGMRWREICTRFGIARATAHRRQEYGLCVILWRLEKRPLPKSWSRRYLTRRARALSGAR